MPTITLVGLSDEQRRAYVIADNKLALNARWDETLLAVELGELQLTSFDLGLTGFSELELAIRLDETVDDHKKEWLDMPEFEQNSVEAFRTMIVHFPTEADFKEWIRVNGIEQLTDKTKFLWWPAVERDITKDLRMVSADE